MPREGHIRHGSLQIYPRVRAKKILPRVNWDAISGEGVNLLGFIGYKVGMQSAYVKDNTPHSLTKGQKIIVPVTILECPTIKILSVRFYKYGKVVGDILNSNLDKELKRKIKIPKIIKKKIEDMKEGDFDEVKVLIYSQVKKTNIKKTPDILEMGLSGSINEKLNFIKTNISKEISIRDVITKGIIDIRGVSKGQGTQGPRKRFGLDLKTHKEEKGQRGPGSGGAWNPARVEFTQPMAGQMGYASRVICNNKIVLIGNLNENNINPKGGFKRYGEIKTDYMLIRGSIQGPKKRQLIITLPLRPSKKQTKRAYDFIELR